MKELCKLCAVSSSSSQSSADTCRKIPARSSPFSSLTRIASCFSRHSASCKTCCSIRDNLNLSHHIFLFLTMMCPNATRALWILRDDKGCALREGQINPHGAAMVQDSPVSAGTTTSPKMLKCCGLPTGTAVR